MKVLNDVTAARLSVFFLQLAAEKKNTENGAAVTSIRTFLLSNDFSHGFASFEQASYIAKWCNKNNFEISGGSKIGYRPTPSLLDSLYLLLHSTMIRKVNIKASPSMDSEGFH